MTQILLKPVISNKEENLTLTQSVELTEIKCQFLVIMSFLVKSLISFLTSFYLNFVIYHNLFQ